MNDNKSTLETFVKVLLCVNECEYWNQVRLKVRSTSHSMFRHPERLEVCMRSHRRQVLESSDRSGDPNE